MLDLSSFYVKLLSDLLSFMASHIFFKLVFSIYFRPEHAVTAASRHHTVQSHSWHLMATVLQPVPFLYFGVLQ